MDRTTGRSWTRAALALFGIGWGANQFVPMLLVYRTHEHLSESAVTAMFGVYALGLIPSLLAAGSFSDQYGRRTVLRPVVVLSVAASLVLVAGSARPGLLYLGRFLAGVASGAAFSAGSAWVKELSAHASEGAGAHRATISLSAGFGGGPLVAGASAQWLPAPTVLPYAVHLALMLAVVPLLWNAPDVGGQDRRERRPCRRRLVPHAATRPPFTSAVVPWAPWVFGTVTVGIAVLPPLVAAHTGGMPVAFNGGITGLTLFTGILVQPFARRLGDVADVVPLVAGLLVAIAGLGVAALVAVTHSPLLVPPAAVLLGASYGVLMVSGLRQTERLAGDGELAGLVAVFYALAYVGFGVPYLLAELAPHFGYARCLLLGALTIALSLVPVVRTLRARRGLAGTPVAATLVDDGGSFRSPSA